MPAGWRPEINLGSNGIFEFWFVELKTKVVLLGSSHERPSRVQVEATLFVACFPHGREAKRFSWHVVTFVETF